MNISTNLQNVDKITIGNIRDLNCDCWTRVFTFTLEDKEFSVTAFALKREHLQIKMQVKEESTKEVTV